MRRTLWRDALVALTMLLVLMGAGRPRKWGAVSSVSSPEWQSETWLFCIDDSGSAHSEWPSSPDYKIVDSTGVLASSGGKRITGPIFKYDHISSASPADSCGTYYAEDLHAYMTANGTMPTHMGIVWWDLARLPEDITITSAKLCMRSRSALTFNGTTQYAMVELDTFKQHEKWLAGNAGAGCTQIGQIRRGAASWNAPRGGVAAWVPPLNDLTETHDLGVRSAKLATEFTSAGEVTWDVTYPVQHYAKYRHANAGFWLRGVRDASAATYALGWQTPRAKMPFLKVTFIRKPYRFLWNDYPIALAWSSDDQKNDNLLWKAISDSFGYKYTLYVRGDAAPFVSGSGNLTTAELKEFYDDGYEIGHHSLNHLEAADNATFRGYGCAEISADRDSMVTEVERSWLASAIGIPTTAIRTFAYPGGGFNMLSIKTLRDYGYLMARGANDTVRAPSTTTYPAYGRPAGRSTDAATWLNPRRASNMFAIGINTSAATLFKTRADPQTFAGLKEVITDVIATCEDNGSMPIMFLVHDQKDTGDYGDYGMDPLDYSWLCRIIQQHGKIGVFTMTDIARMYRNRNMPVAAPAWADSAEADGQVAADSIWWGGGME